jgi:sulfur carrier protein
VNVIVNGEPRVLAPGATVASVVSQLHTGSDARGVAVAVDGEVVRRVDWPAVTLAEGTRVEVLGAIGGGR